MMLFLLREMGCSNASVYPGVEEEEAQQGFIEQRLDSNGQI